MKYNKIRAAVFDMDGVLWEGSHALDGLTDIFDWLHEQRIPYILATNNSSKTAADYVAKLAGMGVDGVDEARIVTSSSATAEYLAKRYPAGTKVHVLGMNGIRRALTDAGFDVDDDAPEVEVVVSGIDFELTYEKLKRTALRLNSDAAFYATNADKTFPSPEGLIPGAGSLLAALETASGRQATVIGKPNAPMYEIALDRLGTAPSETLMVGDRLDTDIAGAFALGMPSVLLFSGVTTPEMLITSDIQPDVAYEDMPSLVRAWAGDAWWVEQRKRKRTQSAR